MRTVKAWHFVGPTLRDGSPIPADCVTLKFGGNPVLCEQGLHASIDAFDALQYAPGATLCRVECGGIIVHGDDKLVCTERTILQRMDADEMLRYFARMQALSVIHLYPNDTDHVVFDYLMTGDESLRAAALAAALAAARAAARAASQAASQAAQVAWAAALDAAWNASRNAARAASREEFNNLVKECFI